jgi:hypothetical protein
MKTLSKIRLAGHVTAEVHDLDGRLIQVVSNHNHVVLTGRNIMRDLINGLITHPTHLGAGLNATVVADSDVGLVEEVTRILVISRTPTVSGTVIRAFMGATVGNGFTYVEAGLFNAAFSDPNSTMFSRATHDSIVKSSNNTITYIWNLDISSL